jgi:hypothetical protein
MAKSSTKKNGAVSAASDRGPTKSREGSTLDPHDIARRAYELYLARGGGHGDDVTDWLLAERELRTARK